MLGKIIVKLSATRFSMPNHSVSPAVKRVIRCIDQRVLLLITPTPIIASAEFIIALDGYTQI